MKEHNRPSSHIIAVSSAFGQVPIVRLWPFFKNIVEPHVAEVMHDSACLQRIEVSAVKSEARWVFTTKSVICASNI